MQQLTHPALCTVFVGSDNLRFRIQQTVIAVLINFRILRMGSYRIANRVTRLREVGLDPGVSVALTLCEGVVFHGVLTFRVTTPCQGFRNI